MAAKKGVARSYVKTRIRRKGRHAKKTKRQSPLIGGLSYIEIEQHSYKAPADESNNVAHLSLVSTD